MKTQINSPTVSKINWAASLTALLNALLALAVIWKYLTPEAAVPVGAIANIALNALIIVFRTKFTNPK